jgi:hypothetical protein
MQPSTHNGNTAAAESRALYVRNIPLSAQPHEVEELFRRFGTVTSFALRQDYHGNAVWVVFVEYETIDSAKMALQALHHTWTIFPGGTAPVLAKFAESEELKQERRRHRFVEERSHFNAHVRCPVEAEPPSYAEHADIPPTACAFGSDAEDSSEDNHEHSVSVNALSGTLSSDSLDESSPPCRRMQYRHNPYCVIGPYVLFSADC